MFDPTSSSDNPPAIASLATFHRNVDSAPSLSLRLLFNVGRSSMTIAITIPSSFNDVEIYDVASGAREFAIFPGFGPVHYLWPSKTSFRSGTTRLSHNCRKFYTTTYKIDGPTPTEDESFSVPMPWRSSSAYTSPSAFSPSTYHVSILDPKMIRIFDVRNTHCLLKESGEFTSPQFSPDGIHFAAYHERSIRIWVYTSDRYMPRGKFLFPYDPCSLSTKILFSIIPNLVLDPLLG